MTKTNVPKFYGIVNGFNSCMDCGCGKFQEGLSTPNICVCGHSYISHHFYKNCHPQLKQLLYAKISNCVCQNNLKQTAKFK